MSKNTNRWPWQNGQTAWFVVVIAGAIFVIFAIAIVREIIQGHQVRQQVARLRQEVAREQQRQQEYQDLIDYLSSPTFQEREARLKLGLKKPGERVIVVPPQTNADQPTQVDENGQPVTPTPVSGPQRWWDYFFGTPPASVS